ncbi:unnamed protein product [Enterobius vermicularis]|uniref:Girdin-like n=1 Tax=Enterobius vermicularis TaxID=51028 RepID=A0A158Q9F3_ENTVE|nr:unnamed protein product [Enterobius vermicularis]
MMALKARLMLDFNAEKIDGMEGLSTQSQRQFCGPELEDEDDGDDFEVIGMHESGSDIDTKESPACLDLSKEAVNNMQTEVPSEEGVSSLLRSFSLIQSSDSHLLSESGVISLEGNVRQKEADANELIRRGTNERKEDANEAHKEPDSQVALDDLKNQLEEAHKSNPSSSDELVIQGQKLQPILDEDGDFKQHLEEAHKLNAEFAQRLLLSDNELRRISDEVNGLKLELHQKELSIRELKSEKNKDDCELRQSEEERRKLEQKLNILTEQLINAPDANTELLKRDLGLLKERDRQILEGFANMYDSCPTVLEMYKLGRLQEGGARDLYCECEKVWEIVKNQSEELKILKETHLKDQTAIRMLKFQLTEERDRNELLSQKINSLQCELNNLRERDKQILEGFANMYDSYSFEAVMCDLECAQETGDSDKLYYECEKARKILIRQNEYLKLPTSAAAAETIRLENEVIELQRKCQKADEEHKSQEFIIQSLIEQCKENITTADQERSQREHVERTCRDIMEHFGIESSSLP